MSPRRFGEMTTADAWVRGASQRAPLLARTHRTDPRNRGRRSRSASSCRGRSVQPQEETADLLYGPGPQVHYVVRKQPPAGSCHYRYTRTKQPLPDRRCTPGVRNPRVTPSTLGATICKAGYTASIRPPSSVTSVEKRLNAKAYGYGGSLRQAEYDHLIPLELGGDPNDPRNLWIEPSLPGHKPSEGFRNPKELDRAEGEVAGVQGPCATRGDAAGDRGELSDGARRCWSSDRDVGTRAREHLGAVLQRRPHQGSRRIVPRSQQPR